MNESMIEAIRGNNPHYRAASQLDQSALQRSANESMVEAIRENQPHFRPVSEMQTQTEHPHEEGGHNDKSLYESQIEPILDNTAVFGHTSALKGRSEKEYNES